MADESYFNIENFRAALSDGVQRNNKYRVLITPPKVLSAYTQTVSNLRFVCHATALPGVTHNVHPVLRYGTGPVEKKPFMAVFNDLNCVFYGDAAGDTLGFFQRWMKNIIYFSAFNAETGESNIVANSFNVAYKEDYETDIELTLFDDSGRPSTGVILHQAYPTSIGDLSLNWQDPSITNIPITFTFYSWDYL